MKLLTAATVLSVVFSASAYAEDYAAITPDALRDQYIIAANKPMPRDPDLERSGYYKRRDYYDSLATPMPQRSFTTDEINNALAFFGRPQLGTSTILHNDKSHEHTSTKTFTESTITYHSGNK